VDTGSHAYACTFVTASGETTPGPLTSIQTGAAGPPADTPTSSPSCQQYPGSGNYSPGPGGGNVGDWVSYSVTYTKDAGGTWADESAMGPGSSAIQIQAYVGGPPNQCLRTVSIGAPPPGVTGTRLYVSVNGMTPAILTWFYTSNYPSGVSGYVVSGMPTQGWYPGPGHGPAANVVNVSNIPTSAGAVTARKLYRQSGGAGLRLVATIGGNTTTTYTDTTPNASLGAAAPGTNTAIAQSVHLSGIPTGPTGVTGRALYRRSGGQGLRFVATIAGNGATTYTDTTPNASLGGAPQGSSTATLQQIPLTAIPLGSSLVTARKVYRTPANSGGGALKLVATIADNTTTTLVDTVPDAALGAAALTVSTAQAAQVSLSAIPVGAPAVIARVLYRTKAGASQLQLRTTINDNTTQTFLDTAADATLGANVPTSDTSLLAQPAGNVLIGSPSLPCATVAGFLPTGGWVTAGSQNLRYTGISGTNLIGIPPSGPGAIAATLSYNTTIVQAAMLNGIPTTGLGVIKYPILKGDPVNVFVQVDNLAAQAAVRVQLPGSDGIIEDEIQDGRLSYTEGRARCQARLDLLSALDSEGKVGVITVSYTCRDVNTIAGATATINLGPPINLRGDFLIQRVGVTQFNIPNLNPTYTVEASSIRFSAEEMLRLLRQGAF
jgi:DNA-binding transcriptional LysR family regulator